MDLNKLSHFLILLIIPIQVSASVITLIDNPVYPVANYQRTHLKTSVEGRVNEDIDILDISTSDFTGSLSSSINGHINTNSYQFNSMALDVQFDHFLSTGGGNLYTSGSIFFNVAQEVTYSLNGIYQAFADYSHHMYFRAWIDDLTVQKRLVYTQQSTGVTNPSLTLGEEQGNKSNSFSGNMAGILTSGHDYVFSFNTVLDNISSGSSGATASGNVTLNIQSVPEPSILALMFTGLIGLGFARRWKIKSVGD